MSRKFWGMVSVLLTLLILSGCAKKEVPAGPTGQADPPLAQSVSGLPDISPGEGWPADAVPSALPAYTEGTVANSGGEASEYTLVIKDTSREALARYLDSLKGSGWIVTGDDHDAEAVMGVYTVRLKWNDSASTWLQIDVHAEQAGTWPLGEIPPDILPPRTGTLAGGVTVLQTADNMWYFDYTYDDTDEAAARAYMEWLIENGWSGDDTMVSKDVEWKGARYRASVEIYETVETRTTFTCNFYLGD